MAAGAAFPGLFFSFAAMVLLIFVSVSVPVWKDISFLHIDVAGTATKFGCWGYCVVGGACSSSKLGFPLDMTTLGVTPTYDTPIVHNLTYVLILNPIGAGLAGLSTIFGIFAFASSSRASTILMTIASLLALLVTLVTFVVDMVIWGIARNTVKSHGGSAMYGNANWLVLGAFVALLIGSCTSCIGSFGRFRSSKY